MSSKVTSEDNIEEAEEYRLIDEDDLPIESSEEFAELFMEEMATYFEKNDLDGSQFDEQATEEEMRTGLYTRIFNEIQVVKYPMMMLEKAKGPREFIQLLKQMEDEAKHARLLAQRLTELGGNPAECFDRTKSADYWKNVIEPVVADPDMSLAEVAANLQGTSEHWAMLRHPNEAPFYDDETQRIYEEVIIPDEKFHAQIGKNILEEYATDEETQRNALAIGREDRERIFETALGVYDPEDNR